MKESDTSTLDSLTPALSRVLKLLMRIALLVVDERSTKYALIVIACLYLHMINDELSHRTILMDSIRDHTSKFLVKFHNIDGN